MSKHTCSFCGEKKLTIEGASGYICSDCCRICKEEFDRVADFNLGVVDLNPYKLKLELDKSVIGQEDAKITLSVAVCNHLKRIKSKNDMIEKSNVLILGPTGCGKTHLMSTIASLLDIPMVIVDATNYTQVGYVGDDVSSILRRLYLKSGMDLERCKYGIVYVDEIDKIMSKVSRSNESDAVGTGVQQNFLKLMEGGSHTFKMPQNGNIVEVTIDTGNILFVFGGAFVGIENTKKPSRSIGFTDGVQQAEISNKITQDDIIKYGFIPEFIGRVPIIVTMERLTREDLKSILISTPKSILHQYKELFALDGIQASFDDALVNEILDGAVSQNTGARGLRGVVEKDIMKLMFEVAKYSNIKNLHITRELLDAPQKSLKSIAKEQQSKEDRISYPEPKALKLS